MSRSTLQLVNSTELQVKIKAMTKRLNGVYAAVVTPFDETGALSVGQFEAELKYLESRGCTGVLIGGSTGEAQSLSVAERISVASEAATVFGAVHMLLGTGAASIEDAVLLTKNAFDLGVEAAVIIPPFFFKSVSQEGLIDFYTQLLVRSVPSDGRVLLYNNPVLTSTEVDTELVRKLVDLFPDQIVGIKDSSSNLENSIELCKMFPEFSIFVGDDRLVLAALQAGAAGAITGISGVFPELLVELYATFSADKSAQDIQDRVSSTHQKFDGFPRIAAFKELLSAGKIIASPGVRPPLRRLTEAELVDLKNRFNYGQTLAQIDFGHITATSE